jgi:hypothetical protein
LQQRFTVLLIGASRKKGAEKNAGNINGGIAAKDELRLPAQLPVLAQARH